MTPEQRLQLLSAIKSTLDAEDLLEAARQKLQDCVAQAQDALPADAQEKLTQFSEAAGQYDHQTDNIGGMLDVLLKPLGYDTGDNADLRKELEQVQSAS